MAIPTTLSGAEMTRGHRHANGVDPATPRVRPSVVVNDPALSASQPVPDLAASSLNALGHAAEAMCVPTGNPVVHLVASESARLLAGAFTRGEPDRDALALGALLGGYAIDAAALGLHHVLAQTLVRRAAIGHGPANAVMLPYTLGALAWRFPERLDALAAALGEDPAEAASRIAAAGGRHAPARSGRRRRRAPRLRRRGRCAQRARQHPTAGGPGGDSRPVRARVLMAPPSRDDLMTLAERALGHASGEAQATAWWERQLSAGPGRAVTTDAVSVEVVDARAAGAWAPRCTTEVDDAGLARAAGAAARLAASGPAARGDLPDPAGGPRARRLRPRDRTRSSRPTASTNGAAGVRRRPGPRSRRRGASVPTSSAASATCACGATGRPGDRSSSTVASVRPGELDPAALAAEADALLGDGHADRGRPRRVPRRARAVGGSRGPAPGRRRLRRPGVAADRVRRQARRGVVHQPLGLAAVRRHTPPLVRRGGRAAAAAAADPGRCGAPARDDRAPAMR